MPRMYTRTPHTDSIYIHMDPIWNLYRFIQISYKRLCRHQPPERATLQGGVGGAFGNVVPTQTLDFATKIRAARMQLITSP